MYKMTGTDTPITQLEYNKSTWRFTSKLIEHILCM